MVIELLSDSSTEAFVRSLRRKYGIAHTRADRAILRIMNRIPPVTRDYVKGVVSHVAPQYKSFPLRLCKPAPTFNQYKNHINVHFDSPHLTQLHKQLASMITPTIIGRFSMRSQIMRWMDQNRIGVEDPFCIGIQCNTSEQARRGRKEMMMGLDSSSMPIPARGLRLMLHYLTGQENEVLYEHIFQTPDEA